MHSSFQSTLIGLAIALTAMAGMPGCKPSQTTPAPTSDGDDGGADGEVADPADGGSAMQTPPADDPEAVALIQDKGGQITQNANGQITGLSFYEGGLIGDADLPLLQKLPAAGQIETIRPRHHGTPACRTSLRSSRSKI